MHAAVPLQETLDAAIWFGGAAGSSVQEILDAANGSVALLAVVSCMNSSTAMTTPNKNQHGENWVREIVATNDSRPALQKTACPLRQEQQHYRERPTTTQTTRRTTAAPTKSNRQPFARTV